MDKLWIISLFLLLTSTTIWSQKGKSHSYVKQVKEDVAILSSKNYPYIEKFHEALQEKIVGNYTEAKKLFKECLKERQDDDAVYFALAEISKVQSQMSEALEYYEKAYTIDPGNTVYLQELAYIHYEKANFEKAKPLFEKLCEKEPQNVDFRYGYIKVLLYNKQYRVAIDQIDRLQDQVGIIPELMGIKADLYLEQKNPKKAEETILELKKEFPDDLEVLETVIDFYKQQGDNEKAVLLMEELITQDPDNGNACYILANLYIENGQKEKLIAISPKIFKAKNLDVEQKLHIFNELKQYKNQEDSVLMNIAEEMYRSYPENNYVSLNYSNSLVIQKRTFEALEVYRNTLKDNPNSFETWASVLSFESRYLDYEALYEDGKEATILFPAMPYSYYAVSEGALKTNRTDEALEYVAAGELYVLDDKKQQALFEMRKGQVYFQTKEYKKGIVKFESALNLDKSKTIQLNYALALAQANIATEVAKELLAQIAEKDQNEIYYKSLALIQRNENNLTKGIEVLEKAVSKQFHNAELYDLLGDLYFNAQNKDKAIEAWKIALKYESRNKVIPTKIKEEKYYVPKYY